MNQSHSKHYDMGALFLRAPYGLGPRRSVVVQEPRNQPLRKSSGCVVALVAVCRVLFRLGDAKFGRQTKPCTAQLEFGHDFANSSVRCPRNLFTLLFLSGNACSAQLTASGCCSLCADLKSECADHERVASVKICLP